MWIKRRPYFRKSRTRKPPGVRWCPPNHSSRKKKASRFLPASHRNFTLDVARYRWRFPGWSVLVRMECNGAGQRFWEEWGDDLESRRGEVFGYNVADFFPWMPFVWVEYFSILGMDLFGRDGCFIVFIDMDVLSYVILKLKYWKEMLRATKMHISNILFIFKYCFECLNFHWRWLYVKS